MNTTSTPQPSPAASGQGQLENPSRLNPGEAGANLRAVLPACTETGPPSRLPGPLRTFSNPVPRETMNGKPVLFRIVKTVLTINNGAFREKKLCDGIVINLGEACAFSCTYCYVGCAVRYQAGPVIADYNRETDQYLNHCDVVIRRKNAIGVLRSQLLKPDGTRRYDDPADNRVVFLSSTVDPAANMELLRETAEACILILKHTNWQIRLLSKCSLLKLLVESGLIPPEYHHRLIFGFSIGTLDDRVAAAIEVGTSPPSKRIEALHWLQDHGIRTFGMICPSLPQEDYDKFSREICAAIRVEKCEHVWAEVLNIRGASMTQTIQALRDAGLEAEALRLEAVSGPDAREAWEQYARNTFMAHAQNIPANNLRFLQYIDRYSADWWKGQRPNGAVLIGKVAQELGYISNPKPAVVPLAGPDQQYLEEREKIITSGIKASIAAAKALHEIFTYQGGRLWKTEFRSFDRYCQARWGYAKSHSHRLLTTGGFIVDLGSSQLSPNGDKLPVNEGQIRPLLAAVPKEHQVECWLGIVADQDPAEITGAMVGAKVKKYARDHGIAAKPEKKVKPGQSDHRGKARRILEDLRAAVENLPCPACFEQPLRDIEILIDQQPPDPDDSVAVTSAKSGDHLTQDATAATVPDLGRAPLTGMPGRGRKAGAGHGGREIAAPPSQTGLISPDSVAEAMEAVGDPDKPRVDASVIDYPNR